MQTSRVVFTVALGAIVVVALATTGPLMSQVEETAYSVERSDGPIEIRAYPAKIVAEATMEGDRKTAIRGGFQLIAAYIFGANAGSRKVEMTAPVTQERSFGDARDPSIQRAGSNTWTVRFVMPRAWSLDTLPTPRDPRVRLKALPPAKFAAIRFSGLALDASINEETERLGRYVETHRLKTSGSPILAFFNPPWTLPFLRRNEVMIELR